MYEPIDFLISTEYDLAGFKKKMTLEEAARECVPEDFREYFTPEEFIDFVLSEDFLSPKSVGDEIKDKLNLHFISKSGELAQVLQVTPSDIQNGSVSIQTEWRDIICSAFFFSSWAKHKQVYKPDRDFAEALIHTEKISLSKDMIEHLPFEQFYIDMSDMKMSDIHGAYVFIKKYDKSAGINIFMLTYDLVYFSNYLTFGYNENGNFSMPNTAIDDRGAFVLPSLAHFSLEEHKSDYKADRREVISLCLQMIAYISSKEPQIVESERTKHTYKPHKHGGTVKNKWSELQIFEVGYQYGSDFRKKLKEMNITDIDVLTSDEEKVRKSPRPHLRCAHWHHYRYGSDRKLIKCIWMPPIFVGFGENPETPIATIHRVTSERK